MPLLEILTIHLGVTITKSVLKLWLQDSEVARDTTIAIATVLEKKIPDFLARRRTEQQLSRMPDDIAENLATFFERECGGLPENEQAAAALAVSDAIRNSQLNPEILLSKDLDPLQLESFVRKENPKAAQDLSTGGTALYDKCLRESCNYIVEIYITLPDFTLKKTQELLRRDLEIISLARKTLDQLPKLQEFSSGLPMPDRKFEQQYRREVARKLNWLELFGVDLPSSSKRYALSVGYITLTASCFENSEKGDQENKKVSRHARIQFDADIGNKRRHVGDGIHRTGRTDIDGASDDKSEIYVRVDEALAHYNRIVIRGEAGSGKTTLLQWLAVQSAQQAFSGALGGWNGIVPFFLQLRRYVDDELPAPDEFISQVGKNSAGEMPAGWIHRQLRAGNGIVLIDGVDELPEERREDAKKWLIQLVEEFHNSRFIVTSRPPAVGQNWLRDYGFEDSELQPMTLTDIDEFIDHWHSAAAQTTIDSDGRTQSDQLKSSLKLVIRENRSIRLLATSPLLCAMLCALNKSRLAKLPKDRMELYKTALEMLIDRRDIERDVPSVEEQNLTAKEKQILLQDFAYWLLKNGYSDIDTRSAAERFSRRISAMPNVSPDHESVFQYILLRSGILRQPVEGRVDFIHRTFEEYLGAKEAIEEDDIGFLVDHSHLDAWKEVIILAVGHATKRQRDQLISSLIERGNGETWHRHKVHLLAVACPETSPELSPELTEKLNLILHSLIPPKTKSDARSLASAGDLAVPLLAGHKDENATTVAACVRALALIGTEKAMSVLSEYGPDARVTVSRELKRAWPSFDVERFAREVLKRSPFEYGRLTVENTSLIPAIKYLEGTTEVHCRLPESIDSLSLIRGIDQITHLRMSGCGKITNLADITTLTNLTSLTLRRCTGITDFSPISTMAELTFLDLSLCKSLTDISGISNLKKLRVLRLGSCTNVEDLSEIGDLINLAVLDLEFHKTISNIDFVENLKKLETIDLRGCKSIKTVNVLSKLCNLSIVNLSFCHSLQNIDGLVGLKELRQLIMLRCSNIGDFGPLSELSALQYLNLSGCNRLTKLPDFSSLKNLIELDLEYCDSYSDLSTLGSCEKLISLDLGGCTCLSNLDPLVSAKSLQTLNIAGCTSIVDLSPLNELPRLRNLYVAEMGDRVVDLSPLSNRKGLNITVSRTGHYNTGSANFGPSLFRFWAGGRYEREHVAVPVDRS